MKAGARQGRNLSAMNLRVLLPPNRNEMNSVSPFSLFRSFFYSRSTDHQHFPARFQFQKLQTSGSHSQRGTTFTACKFRGNGTKTKQRRKGMTGVLLVLNCVLPLFTAPRENNGILGITEKVIAQSLLLPVKPE